jgi:quercetin dioxygenase-like cupin family protein
MRRHHALVPLSHDHHHSLVEARRLRRAADGPGADSAARAFLRFFRAESVRHFREEEELLFPLVAGLSEAREPVVRALLEHQRLHALAAELEPEARDGRPAPEIMRELGELVDVHVRYEERELFPLIERLASDVALGALALEPVGTQPVRPGSTAGGPVWGAESEDLNATMLVWGPGAGPPAHVNEERDVLVAVIDGSATLGLDDDEEHRLEPGAALIIGKGRRRLLSAGPDGVRYLSAHLRRPRLQIGRRAPAAGVESQAEER